VRICASLSRMGKGSSVAIALVRSGPVLPLPIRPPAFIAQRTLMDLLRPLSPVGSPSGQEPDEHLEAAGPLREKADSEQWSKGPTVALGSGWNRRPTETPVMYGLCVGCGRLAAEAYSRESLGVKKNPARRVKAELRLARSERRAGRHGGRVAGRGSGPGRGHTRPSAGSLAWGPLSPPGVRGDFTLARLSLGCGARTPQPSRRSDAVRPTRATSHCHSQTRPARARPSGSTGTLPHRRSPSRQP